jgi:hypothetical protein
MFCHASAIHPTAEAGQARYGLSGAIPVKEKKKKERSEGVWPLQDLSFCYTQDLSQICGKILEACG